MNLHISIELTLLHEHKDTFTIAQISTFILHITYMKHYCVMLSLLSPCSLYCSKYLNSTGNDRAILCKVGRRAFEYVIVIIIKPAEVGVVCTYKKERAELTV